MRLCISEELVERNGDRSRLWSSKASVGRGSLGGNVPFSWGRQHSQSNDPIHWLLLRPPLNNLSIKSSRCMIYGFEMGLENKAWNDNLRQVSKHPSQPSPLHPVLSNPVTDTHTRHIWRNTRTQTCTGDIRLLCWPWNVQTVWLKHKTLSTLVDKQCMIHKASKELERVRAGEGVCVG